MTSADWHTRSPQAAYRRVLEAATAVLVGTNARVRHLAPRATVTPLPLGRLPRHTSVDRPPPDLAPVSDASLAISSPMVCRHRSVTSASPTCLPDPAARTILTYGKIGTIKGTFDLVPVLTRLAELGEPFNFVAVAAGPSQPLRSLVARLLECAPLAARTHLLPPVAPWHVPALIRMATAVCVLEREFPIEFHAPISHER